MLMQSEQLTGIVAAQTAVMKVMQKERDVNAEPMEMVIELTIKKIFNAYIKEAIF